MLPWILTLYYRKDNLPVRSRFPAKSRPLTPFAAFSTASPIQTMVRSSDFLTRPRRARKKNSLAALPCLRAGCAHGGRGERGLFLIISVSSEAGVYRLLAGAVGFLISIGIIGQSFRDFLQRLTGPTGRRYTTDMDRGERNSPQHEKRYPGCYMDPI